MSNDDETVPADERPVMPDPDAPASATDSEVPEADAVEQAHEVEPGAHVGEVSRGYEVPEADAIDQATEVPEDTEG